MSFLRGHWQLFVILAGVFALWNTPAMVPLKILIVFLHEFSHAVATVLTGGRVVSLSVSPDFGGMVLSQGGNRFVTLTAGYLGSLGIGVLLLFGALRSTADRKIMAACGLVVLLVAALYIRDSFAVVFTCGAGVAMLALARFCGHDINDLALRAIGLTSMIYVPFDIFSDTIARAHLQSDAYMLAEEFGGTTMFWGGLWLVISLAVIAWSLRHLLGQDSNLHWHQH